VRKDQKIYITSASPSATKTRKNNSIIPSYTIGMDV